MVVLLSSIFGCSENESDTPRASHSTAVNQDHNSLPSDAGSDSSETSSSPTIVVSTHRDQAHENELGTAYDPRKDGWSSEVFHEESGKVLRVISSWLIDRVSGNGDPELLNKVIGENIEVGQLVPRQVKTVFDDGVMRIDRPLAGTGSVEQGQGAFLSETVELLKPWISADGGSEIRPFLKQYRVLPDGKRWKSTVLYSAVGKTAAGLVQQNATWQCQWEVVNKKPRLASIKVTGFEQILKRSAAPLFSDCTLSLMESGSVYKDQLQFGANHWVERMAQYAPDALQGLAIGDINGDMLEDVYVCQGKGLPNRLLLAQPDGTVVDASAQFGVDLLDETRSALIVDLDNDGDQDMVIATTEFAIFYENTGGEKLEKRLRLPTADTSSIAAADVDNDGLLDIYICGYQNALHEIGVLANPVPYHDATNGAPNYMIRNQGSWKFIDVTKAWGLNGNNNRFSLAAAFDDFDNDGDTDLYVTNDFGRNNLYKNQATRGETPRFVDTAALAGVEDTSFGMSVAWGDVNRDGRMDLYISNMFSAAGNRVTYQRQFKEGSDGKHLEQMRYLARGNSLFLNQGNGRFVDVSEPAGVMNSQWTWASRFCDINNDGWLDILATNGFLTGPKAGDL
jgi:hypothetical protein